jgi:hypothetical protein
MDCERSFVLNDGSACIITGGDLQPVDNVLHPERFPKSDLNIHAHPDKNACVHPTSHPLVQL